MTTQAIIGAYIRLLREKAGLTQEDLASQANISYQYLSGIETGKENFTILVLEKLVKVLNAPLKSIISLAYENADGTKAPVVNPAFFRRGTPLPGGLTFDHLKATLDHTQAIIHRINKNMQSESNCTLQSLIHTSYAKRIETDGFLPSSTLNPQNPPFPIHEVNKINNL